MSLPPALVITGPTAAGKSAVAMALAERLPVEVVSVDSAAVYRGMDLGTAKPDAAERARVPHHLIDIVDPTNAYSAAAFRADALRLLGEISARGRLPLLVGGTMLYLKALREGLSDLPGSDPAVRAAIDERAARLGWPALHAELAAVDPASAARLAPNDAQRIQRALEVWQIAGRPLSALTGAGREAPALPCRLHVVGLMPADRALLHQVIARRFDAMLAAGLVDEVADLRRRLPLHAGLPSMRAVGYRQAWEYLDGAIDAGALRDKGIAATRQLAKRQMTWLRAMAGVELLPALEPDTVRLALGRCLEAVGGEE